MNTDHVLGMPQHNFLNFELAAPDRYTNALFISFGDGAELGKGSALVDSGFNKLFTDNNFDFGGGRVSTVLQHAPSAT